MATLNPARDIALEQAFLHRDMTGFFQRMLAEVSSYVGRYFNEDDRIHPRDEVQVLAGADAIVTRYFVGTDGRNAWRDLQPQALFPRILDQHVASVVGHVVLTHHTWWKSKLPEDVRAELDRQAKALNRSPIFAEQTDPRLSRRFHILFADSANPNLWKSGYEAPHTWVDPQGYRLSDRVWRASQETRSGMDRFLTYAVRNGMSARSMSKELELLLLPDKMSRTNRPYGQDLSFPAMRLARTEVARAGNQASFMSAKVNPYVDGMDWVLSGSHPRYDICDQIATMGAGGNRLAPPMPMGQARIPPAHPHCLCHSQPHVAEGASFKEVTDGIRSALDDIKMGRSSKVVAPTPSVFDQFWRELIDDIIQDRLIQLASEHGLSVPARLLVSQLV